MSIFIIEMKTFVVLFAVYLLFIIAQPLVCVAYCTVGQTENCCVARSSNQELPANNKKPNQEHNNNCCNDGVCNPCMSCSYCCFVAKMDQNSFQFSTILADIRNLRITNDKVIAGYLTACWHPPEIA